MFTFIMDSYSIFIPHVSFCIDFLSKTNIYPSVPYKVYSFLGNFSKYKVYNGIIVGFFTQFRSQSDYERHDAKISMFFL
jgi:hypothetical protein